MLIRICCNLKRRWPGSQCSFRRDNSYRVPINHRIISRLYCSKIRLFNKIWLVARYIRTQTHRQPTTTNNSNFTGKLFWIIERLSYLMRMRDENTQCSNIPWPASPWAQLSFVSMLFWCPYESEEVTIRLHVSGRQLPSASPVSWPWRAVQVNLKRMRFRS